MMIDVAKRTNMASFWMRNRLSVKFMTRIITRKLVEQQQRKLEEEQRLFAMANATPGVNGSGSVNGYFDYPGSGNGSFRLGAGDKRRSWMGFPTTPNIGSEQQQWEEQIEQTRKNKGGRCC